MGGVFVFKQPPPGFITEYFGGGGGKGGGGGTTVQKLEIPPEVLARYNAVNARAESVASAPFQPYTGEFVAPLNATQTAGINATSNASQMAQPFYNSATQATFGGMKNIGPLTQNQIGYYQNPFTQAVVDPTVRALQQQQGMQLSDQQSQAIKGGAFGGDRSGLQRAQLQGQQNLAMGQAIAPIYERGYNTAVQTAMGQQGVVAADLARQLAGGQQLGNLGSAAQQAALTGAQAQIAAGTLPQQTQQAEDTAKYQQFQQEKGYPFQTTQFLANIAEGTGALSGNTQTQQQGGGFFSSDARLKENIEPVGELFDGQKVYRYNFKDDPDKKTQIGIIAQEAAAKRKPGLGIDDDGFLAVNYRDVTDEAAETGKGLVPNSMGGAVRSAGAYARGGYAVGGGGVDFGSLVAAHRAMYDEGKKKEAGLNIPAAAKAPKGLSVPAMMKPDKQPNAAEQAMKTGQGIAQTGEAIKKMSDWPKGVKDYFGGKKLEDRANTPGAQSPAGASGTPGSSGPAASQKTVVPGSRADASTPTGNKMAGYDSNLRTGANGQVNVADANGNVDASYAGRAVDVPRPAGVGNVYGGPQVEGAPSNAQAFSGPGLGQYGDSFGRAPAGTGVVPQQYASANNLTATDARFDIPKSAAQPPIQDLKEQELAFEGVGGGSDLADDASESLNKMGDSSSDFASSLDSFGDFADYGDMGGYGDMADVRDFADFGDAASFFKHGGRTHNPFAYGGVVPRQHYIGGGPALPYDPSDNPNKILDSTLAEQDDDAKDDASQFKNSIPKMGGSGGDKGGGDGKLGIGKMAGSLIGSAFGPLGSMAGGLLGGFLPFNEGGVVPRQHHANGEAALDDNTTFVEQSPRLSREDLSAEAEPTGLDTRLVATTSDKADPDFDRSLRKTLKIEGGYTNDSGGPTMMGISSKANPDVDLKRVASDPQYKADIYRSRYYDPIVTPDMTPEMKTLAFDTAVNHGVTKAKELVGAAEGNPAKLLQLRQQHYDSLIAENPDKYARYDKGWRNRLASLSSEAGGEPAAPKSGLGSFLSGKSGKGMYDGVEAKNASLGDVFREYAPKGLPTSENAILPALGFLGGMLSSPNPKLLGAIGSGLVSGVSTQFELDKLNEERVKNAYNLMKDRFVDSMQTDANGMPYLMKMDKDTNKLYTTEQMAAIRANIFKASGVSARSFEEMNRADQQTTKGDMAVSQSAPAAAPKPGEVKVADSAAGAASPGTTPATAADPVAAAAEQRYPKPSEDISKTDMTVSQLEADAFHNPQKYGLREDPKILLGNIQKARKNAEFWQKQGTKDGSENANRLETYIANEDKKLNEMLAKATKFQVEKNTEIVKATVGDAKAYGDKIAARTAIYREKRRELLTLADLQAAGLETGYGAETIRDMESLYSTLTGGKDFFALGKNNKDRFDEALKISAMQIVNGIKEAELQRAPGAGLKTEGRIVPGPGMSSGAIHKLIGSTLGEMDYVHERDKEYVAKHRHEDPTTFLMNYDSKKDPKTGYAGDHRLNKKIADAFSTVPVPRYGDGIPETIKDIHRKYREYGYSPLIRNDAAAPAAASGKSVVRSGTVNSGPNAGKKIIEYSDGTKEYQ